MLIWTSLFGNGLMALERAGPLWCRGAFPVRRISVGQDGTSKTAISSS
jgi:hypothetical protein